MPASSTTPRVCRTSVLVWATSVLRSPSRLGGLVGRRGRSRAPCPKGWPGLGGLLGGGAAHLGSATSIGKLSVPATWAGAVEAAPRASAIPVSTVSAAPEAAGGPGNLLGGMPLAGGGSGAAHGAGPRYGVRPTVMART